MKINIKNGILFLTLFFLVAGNCVSFGSTTDELQTRMAARKGDILKLLTAGKAGENFVGFLDAKGSLSDSEKNLMDSENSDRNNVYKAIAEKNKTSLDAVGSLRAKTIREQLPSGVWMQSKKDKWEKKS